MYPGEAINDDIAMNRYEWRAAHDDARGGPGISAQGVHRRRRECRRLLLHPRKRRDRVSRRCPDEPDRRNYARLAENIERNALAGIAQARGCAVGDRRGTASLTPGPEDNAGWSKLNGTGLDEYAVDVVTLDDETRHPGQQHPDQDRRGGLRNGSPCRCRASVARRNGGYAQIEARGDEHADKVTKLMSDYGWRAHRSLPDRFELRARVSRDRRRPTPETMSRRPAQVHTQARPP